MNAHASSSRLSLDLACPLPWPSSSSCAGEGSSQALPLDTIAERYHHALYLGEQHTPLQAFVVFSRKHIAHYGAASSRTCLIDLLRSAPPREQGELLGLDAQSLRALALAPKAAEDGVEGIRWSALASGPGVVVGEEIRNAVHEERSKREEEERQDTQVAALQEEEDEGVRHGKWAAKWVGAMQTRE